MLETQDTRETQGLLPNLHDFTVQIRHAKTGAIVGTGFVVSEDKVVTAAHVVRDAGVQPSSGTPLRGWLSLLLDMFRRPKPHSPQMATVRVYFPRADASASPERRATILAGFWPKHDDDVLILQLIDGSAPIRPDQIAVLGKGDGSDNHPFRSYGFPQLTDEYIDGWLLGTVMGSVLPPLGRRWQVGPLELKADRKVRGGMSGAPVLDMTSHRVVGVVTP